ncbi:unnamed protein product [Sphagnum balticum]
MTQRQSAKALANLATNADNKRLIASKGGILPLIRLAQVDNISVSVEAIAALGNLAVNEVHRLMIVESGCVEEMLTLARQNNEPTLATLVIHVHATINEDNKIFYQGDSDAQLTKGLLALLINGLSGSTNEEIQAVRPEFVQFAGIGASLTPGRNNGFLNMLRLMKVKANQLTQQKLVSSTMNGGKTFESITRKLKMLRPVHFEVIDESHKHAGHAAMSSLSTDGETHFKVSVVAECFQGMSLVQRHKMIYTLLSEELNGGVHALSISAKTPQESG